MASGLTQTFAPVAHFDPETHRYYLGERLIPGISQVLRDFGFQRFGNAGTELENEVAMARGKAVHAATHYYDEDCLDWSTVDDVVLPYVEAWAKFREETGYVPTLAWREKWLVHPQLAFGGTPDCGRGHWKLNGNIPLIEIKTGEPEAWWPLQLAGQEILLRNLAPTTKNVQRVSIQLSKDGRWKPHFYEDYGDVPLFASLVAAWWWKANKQIKTTVEEAQK